MVNGQSFTAKQQWPWRLLHAKGTRRHRDTFFSRRGNREKELIDTKDSHPPLLMYNNNTSCPGQLAWNEIPVIVSLNAHNLCAFAASTE